MKVDESGVVTFTIQPHDCSVCGHQHGGEDVGYICVGCPCPEQPGKLPDDWYDGTAKRCPRVGELPILRFTGELVPSGSGEYIKSYTSTCPCCNVAFEPGEPMPEHGFIPARPGTEYTFREGAVLYGMEPQPCDGDHGPPSCEDPQCWRRDPRAGDAKAPRIVVLCGSTRFFAEFQLVNYEETMKGRIVLSVGFAPGGRGSRPPRTGYRNHQTGVWHPAPTAIDYELHRIACADCKRTDDPDGHGESVGCTPEQKRALEELHKRKIDLADEVIVLNVGGYIGKSTASEIAYAEENGKPIRWLEPPVDLCGFCHYPLGEQPQQRVRNDEDDVEIWHLSCAHANAGTR